MTMLEMKTIESAPRRRATRLVRSLAARNEIMIERSADEFDAALLAAERESAAQNMAQDYGLLRQLKAALHRFNDGTFGICLRCEEEIASKRLQAIPWAAYCVSCQEKVEEAAAFTPGQVQAA
jgi:DnaK suppressor protein